MSVLTRVRSISYLKAHAADIARFEESDEPLFVTQNGEVKMVVQSATSYQQTQETLALLKILALGEQDIEGGRHRDAFAVLDREVKRRNR